MQRRSLYFPVTLRFALGTMKRSGIFPVLLAAALFGGCACLGNKDQHQTVKEEEQGEGVTLTPAISLRQSSRSSRRHSEGNSAAMSVPGHEGRAYALCDFGMSVRTNFEVSRNGEVEWMRISGVDRGSSAAEANLRPGDRILAIGGRPLKEFGRDAMLEIIFYGKNGVRMKFLVLGAGDALAQFVTLTSRRPVL